MYGRRILCMFSVIWLEDQWKKEIQHAVGVGILIPALCHIQFAGFANNEEVRFTRHIHQTRDDVMLS